eukprot:scaffold2352_cov153-Ochromonas_danica.AAC.20
MVNVNVQGALGGHGVEQELFGLIVTVGGRCPMDKHLGLPRGVSWRLDVKRSDEAPEEAKKKGERKRKTDAAQPKPAKGPKTVRSSSIDDDLSTQFDFTALLKEELSSPGKRSQIAALGDEDDIDIDDLANFQSRFVSNASGAKGENTEFTEPVLDVEDGGALHFEDLLDLDSQILDLDSQMAKFGNIEDVNNFPKKRGRPNQRKPAPRGKGKGEDDEDDDLDLELSDLKLQMEGLDDKDLDMNILANMDIFPPEVSEDLDGAEGEGDEELPEDFESAVGGDVEHPRKRGRPRSGEKSQAAKEKARRSSSKRSDSDPSLKSALLSDADSVPSLEEFQRLMESLNTQSILDGEELFANEKNSNLLESGEEDGSFSFSKAALGKNTTMSELVKQIDRDLSMPKYPSKHLLRDELAEKAKRFLPPTYVGGHSPFEPKEEQEEGEEDVVAELLGENTSENDSLDLRLLITAVVRTRSSNSSTNSSRLTALDYAQRIISFLREGMKNDPRVRFDLIVMEPKPWKEMNDQDLRTLLARSEDFSDMADDSELRSSLLKYISEEEIDIDYSQERLQIWAEGYNTYHLVDGKAMTDAWGELKEHVLLSPRNLQALLEAVQFALYEDEMEGALLSPRMRTIRFRGGADAMAMGLNTAELDQEFSVVSATTINT